MIGSKVRRAAAGRTVPAGGFSPLDIGWTAAYWADDLSLADGASVTLWPDSSGNSYDLEVPATLTDPTFQSANTDLGSQPAVTFSNGAMTSPLFPAAILPFTMVIVGRTRSTASNQPISTADTFNDSSPAGLLRALSGNFAVYNGAGENIGTADTDGHIFLLDFTAGGDDAQIDGGSVLSMTAGGLSAIRVTLGRFGSVIGVPDIAFVGLHDGPLTSTERADLLTWSQDKYSTP